MPSPPPTFVIGPPRSGTTLLRDLLAEHPDLSVHGEDFHPFHHDLGLFADRQPGLDHFRLTAAEANDGIRRRYEEAIAAATGPGTGTSDRAFVLKISTLSLQVDYLRALFPKARFVQLVRDGRDAACSMEDLRRTLEKRQGTPRELGPAADPLGLVVARLSDHKPMRAAASWAYHISRSFWDLRFAGPDSHLRIRYEDLLAQPTQTLARVLTFLGVGESPRTTARCAEIRDAPTGPGSLGYSASEAPGRKRGRFEAELDADDRLLLAPWLEQSMLLAGYEPDPWPEREPFYAACARKHVDADRVRDALKAEQAYVRGQIEAFAPGRQLSAPRLGPGSRLLLIDGALCGTQRSAYDGAPRPFLSFVQKQERRMSFWEADGEWPLLARRLDGKTPIADLVRPAQLEEAVAMAQRLADQGFVAAV